jgi:L-alanine-DL-glutamate epimerase-like enolase superfamily enzyme
MRLSLRTFELKLAHPWAIARSLTPGAGGAADVCPVVFVELRDDRGTVGLGEAAPSDRYGEDPESTATFLRRVEPGRLSFTDLAASRAYLAGLPPGQGAARCALDLALLDGAARLAGQPVYDYLGLGFAERRHHTSFSIGIDEPEVIHRKVLEAGRYPVLKLKLGGPHDRPSLAALRAAAPRKPVRVDANEAWTTREEARRNLEWLSADGHIEFVEQAMPAGTAPRDLLWLKERSPLPLMADEAYQSARDVAACAAAYHAVNVKLVKTGGIHRAYEALKAAREAGLKTMIGCMIESSLLISAAAHLAELADYLDLDGSLLITNDPYQGVTAEAGQLSFAQAPEPVGLRVCPRRQPEPA